MGGIEPAISQSHFDPALDRASIGPPKLCDNVAVATLKTFPKFAYLKEIYILYKKFGYFKIIIFPNCTHN